MDFDHVTYTGPEIRRQGQVREGRVTPDQLQAKKPRSRKLYVLWAIALTLLISTALFCWLVVVPVWQFHRAIQEHSSAYYMNMADAELVIERLGGPKQTIAYTKSYLRLPYSVCSFPMKGRALSLLLHCGRGGQDAYLQILRDGDEGACWLAIYTLLDMLHFERPPEVCHSLLSSQDTVARLAEAMAYHEGLAAPSCRDLLVLAGTKVGPAIPILTRHLDNKNLVVKRSALEVIDNMDAVPTSCEPALRRMLNDQDPYVQEVAAEVLKKIKAAQEKK